MLIRRRIGTGALRVAMVIMALLFCSLLAGCGPPSGAGGGNEPAAGGAASARKAPGLSLYDGFEGDALAGFWRPGDYGSGRYVPGAVTITDAYARTGTRSVRITVKEGDVEQTGDDNKLTERAELDSGKHPLVGRDVWYGFSFLIPAGFPVVDNRLVIAQWKQGGVHGGPLIAERFRAGRHELTLRTSVSSWNDRKYSLPRITFGRWNDMIYHVRFSPGQDGCVEVWMNGKRVVSYEGSTAIGGGEEGIYNKFGLYRDRWKEPMTIYFDDYTLGDSFAAVDPARLDGRP